MKTNKSVQMYGSATADADGLATITMVRNGTIKAVVWNLEPAQIAQGDSYHFEVSSMNARQHATNDASGIISACTAVNSASSASGAGQLVDNAIRFWTPANHSYRAGDKIYLHHERGGSANAVKVRALLWCEE